jgi:hypothetical protein
MKIVSGNSEEDLEKQRQEAEKAQKQENIEYALRRVRTALRDLTSNLLRIVRSPSTGGKPYQVAHETVALLKAFQEYQDVAGHLPPTHDISEALSTKPCNESIEKEIERWDPVRSAEDTIIGGALQIMASRLLGQGTIETRGEYEMYDGINTLEQAREQRERKWQEERKKWKAEGTDTFTAQLAMRAARAAVKAKAKAPAPAKPAKKTKK